MNTIAIKINNLTPNILVDIFHDKWRHKDGGGHFQYFRDTGYLPKKGKLS